MGLKIVVKAVTKMVTRCLQAKSYRSKNMGLCLWIICKLHLYDMVDRRDHTELPMSGKLWVEPPQSWKRSVVWDCKTIGISPEIHLLPIGLESVQGFLFVPSRLKSETKQTSFKKLQDTLDLWSNSSCIRLRVQILPLPKIFFNSNRQKSLRGSQSKRKRNTLTHCISQSSSSQRRRGDKKRMRKKWRHYLKHQSYLPCKRC